MYNLSIRMHLVVILFEVFLVKIFFLKVFVRESFIDCFSKKTLSDFYNCFLNFAKYIIFFLSKTTFKLKTFIKITTKWALTHISVFKVAKLIK